MFKIDSFSLCFGGVFLTLVLMVLLENCREEHQRDANLILRQLNIMLLDVKNEKFKEGYPDKLYRELSKSLKYA